MKELKALLKVKTIVTLLFAICYNVLAFIGKVDFAEYGNIVNMIIIFYFGTQAGKAEAKSSKSELEEN